MIPFRHCPSVALSGLLLVLAGCTSLAPDYQRPQTPVPAYFGAGTPSGQGTPADNAPQAQLSDRSVADAYMPPAWQAVFLDPHLQQVLALALDNNRDLRVALLNIGKARAQYRIQGADAWPTVGASGQHSAARSVTSNDSTQVSRNSSLTAGITSWELDLFGRIASLKQEALETYLATEQTQRSARLSLLAEVADAWLEISAASQRLTLAKSTLDSQQRTLMLTLAMHAEGVVSGVDLASVQGSVESARVDVATYATTLSQARNALDLLAGASVAPGLLPLEQTSTTPDSEVLAKETMSSAAEMSALIALADVPANLSSAVLLQRPDVMAAEHALKAANADIGAARAAFFPKISLTAAAGIGSQGLSDLFDGGSHRVWSFVPSVTVPIFQGGALRAELEVAKISRDITVAQYEKAIQSAFREVVDALAVRQRIDERLQAQRALVAATQRSYQLADARYRNGLDSYLETLTAQRSLYSAQQNLITLQLAEAANRITLYKVLGGGADADSTQQFASNQIESAQVPQVRR